jgi:hypothetical protein
MRAARENKVRVLPALRRCCGSRCRSVRRERRSASCARRPRAWRRSGALIPPWSPHAALTDGALMQRTTLHISREHGAQAEGFSLPGRCRLTSRTATRGSSRSCRRWTIRGRRGHSALPRTLPIGIRRIKQKGTRKNDNAARPTCAWQVAPGPGLPQPAAAAAAFAHVAPDGTHTPYSDADNAAIVAAKACGDAKVQFGPVVVPETEAPNLLQSCSRYLV